MVFVKSRIETPAEEQITCRESTWGRPKLPSNATILRITEHNNHLSNVNRPQYLAFLYYLKKVRNGPHRDGHLPTLPTRFIGVKIRLNFLSQR